MAKRAGAYKSEKRKKELMRLKKQEEKRKRRLSKPEGASEDADSMGHTEGVEPPADTDQAEAGTETKE